VGRLGNLSRVCLWGRAYIAPETITKAMWIMFVEVLEVLCFFMFLGGLWSTVAFLTWWFAIAAFSDRKLHPQLCSVQPCTHIDGVVLSMQSK
jgi:hypothetical protein